MSIRKVEATVDNVTSPLALNESSGKYEARLTAPSESSAELENHFYPVSVTAENSTGSSVTLDSDSENFGDSLRLYVSESTEPFLEIATPTDGEKFTTEYIALEGVAGSDFVEKPALRLIVNGENKGKIAYDSDIDFSTTVRLRDGENEITVTVDDGMDGVLSQTIHVFLDRYPPVFRSVTISPSKLRPGEAYTISVEVE